MKRLATALLLFYSTAFAQILNLASPPPPPAAGVNVSQTGVQGFTTYYYQVVTHYTSGVVFSAPVQVQTSNATLTGGNYNTVNWTAAPGALSYDVLRFTTAAGYSTTC